MIKAGVIGSTGYAGQELVRLLLSHPDVKISFVSSKSYAGASYSDIFPNFYKKMYIDCISTPEDLSELDIDVLFTALPHGHTSGMISSKILKKFKVIDLGADFRLKEINTYENWYQVKHESPQLLPLSVYGLCEINRESIAKSNLIANPGCYTTCSILAIVPLLKESLIDPSSIIIDAKSGVTGAGRGLDLSTHYTECNESIKAYKIASHRHTPEIEEQLSISAGHVICVNFTPHLVPMNRGILCTSYANLKEGVHQDTIKKAYEKYYGDEPFIRLLPNNTPAETRWVKGSNFVDIGFSVDLRTNRIIVTSALDNLIKGAAGQAIQNMNIAFNIQETTGLDHLSIFPI
jgi:N-acetyl-gamma-glutamyl-phosphate reductase